MQTSAHRTTRRPLAFLKLVAPLTADQLAEALLPLRRDYTATVAATAALPIKERAPIIQARIEAYSAAFSTVLGEALDDATAATLGEWARGGR
jgi:hypothetical protein